MSTNTDPELYLRVTLKSDPTVEVWVKTTESKQAAKRRAIRGDISYQKFARWAPFAGQEYDTRAFKLDKTTPFFE